MARKVTLNNSCRGPPREYSHTNVVFCVYFDRFKTDTRNIGVRNVYDYRTKKLVRYWLFLAAVISIGIYISLSDIEEKQMAIFVLTIPAVIVSLFQDFTYYSGYGAKGERMGAFIEKHPIVKYWLVIFCLTILPFMVYEMGTTNNDKVQGYLYFLSIFLLVAPVALVSEIDRFRSLG